MSTFEDETKINDDDEFGALELIEDDDWDRPDILNGLLDDNYRGRFPTAPRRR